MPFIISFISLCSYSKSPNPRAEFISRIFSWDGLYCMQNKTELCFQKLLYALLLLLFGFQRRGSLILCLYLQQVTWVKSKGTLHLWKLTQIICDPSEFCCCKFSGTLKVLCLSFMYSFLISLKKNLATMWSRFYLSKAKYIYFIQFYFLYIYILWLMLAMISSMASNSTKKDHFCCSCTISVLLIAFFFFFWCFNLIDGHHHHSEKIV